MKRLALLLIIAECACSKGDYNLMPSDLRGGGFDRTPRSQKEEKQQEAKALMDTIIYISAISVPPGYDWRKDSACGLVNGEIILYKNYETCLRIPGGSHSQISLEPDMHHLIGGHIYSEYSDNTHTYVFKDGKELFRYQGREFLRALLPQGDSLYTLGQSRVSQGFSLRLNGEPLFLSTEGRISGGFGDSSFDGKGALFKTGEHLYFSYYLDGKKHLWKDGHEADWSPAAAGRGHTKAEVDDNCIHYSCNNIKLDIPYPREGNYLFPTEGACLFDGKIFQALTPVDTTQCPYALTDSGKVEINVNGFLCNMEIVIEPVPN